MVDPDAQSKEAIREAWAFWLKDHPIIVRDAIRDSVKDVIRDWMIAHSDELRLHVNTEIRDSIEAVTRDWVIASRDELLTRIAEEVAKLTPPPGSHTDPPGQWR